MIMIDSQPNLLATFQKSVSNFSSVAAGLIAVIALSGCQTMSKESASQFIEVVPPKSGAPVSGKSPVVFYLQGTGGGNIRAELWLDWFGSMGIAAVIIDSARMRDRPTLDGIDSYHEAGDLVLALDVVKDHPALDLNHYAVMGFSRGGTASLQAGSVLSASQPRPDYVFSMYPGGAGVCSNSYGPKTRVMVFYGELDGSGTRNGNRDRCKSMTLNSENAVFHGFAETHHGFDGLSTESAFDGSVGYLIAPNASAVQQTRQLILQELKTTWLRPN